MLDMFTCVLSKLLQAWYVNEVRRQAGVWLSETDARRAGCSSSVAPRWQTSLDVGAHLATVRPPVTLVILPFPHRYHGLRLPDRSRGCSWHRRPVSRPVYPGTGPRHNCHIRQNYPEANNNSFWLASQPFVAATKTKCASWASLAR